MPDLIMIHGKLHTQDPTFPAATALATRGKRFVAVGTDWEILALATPETRIINLEKSLVLPGLMDTHIHFYDWAHNKKQLQLGGEPSLASAMEKLGQYARAIPPGEWILGFGWIESAWKDGRLPNRKDLDEAAPRHPIILWRTDLHLAVVNSLALERAGITAETSDPAQGVIDRDASGCPTGILRELAINLVSGNLPTVPRAQRMDAIKEASSFFHSLGLVGIHDQRIMGAPEGAEAFRTWQAMHASGEISLRVWMNLPAELLDQAVSLGLRTGFGDEKFRVGHLKFFADGAQGPRTAWMFEPYENDTSTGLPLTPINEMATAIAKADAAGLAVSVHAIGDRANHELITVFESLQDHKSGWSGSTLYAPHKIEHLQIIRPEDLSRLAKLHVVASLQPLQVTDDIPIMLPTIGERSRFAYPFRSIWEAGVPVTFNSDCPVCDPNPFWGIHAAVTRQRRDGTPVNGWHPEQRISVAQAVWAYTMGAAISSGQGAHLGSISPGKLADLVVVDRDIFSIDPQEIFQAKPVMTLFDGEIVYEA
jgi:predicted amidohydrolase YtcJ